MTSRPLWVVRVRVASAMLALIGLLLPIDLSSMQAVAHWRTPLAMEVMRRATLLGMGSLDLGVAGALLLAGYVGHHGKLFQVGRFAVFSVLVSGVAAQLVKHGLCRSRPFLPDGGTFHFFPCAQAAYASFPSGHATTAFALAVVLAAAYPRWRTPFYAAAALVLVSRIYLGLHYPSDVVAGAFIGWTVGTGYVGRMTSFLAKTPGRSGVPPGWRAT